jgi:DNA polymerase I-like protein with 3'-5' exonuclease and polymerase domains
MITTLDKKNGYRATLLEMEQELCGPSNTQFPIQVDLAGQAYQFDIWNGQQLPDRLLAYDTETTLIQDREIPQLAVATVYGDQGSCYFIHPSDLSQFVIQHGQSYWCCHNAVFDFWVTTQALQPDLGALDIWWDVAGAGRLCCTMLLDCLIRLGQTDAEPINRDLGTVAAQYCGLKLDKQDPYRLRYGELIEPSAFAWRNVEPGFWKYAAKDPIATLQVAQRQFQISQQQIQPYASKLLPDASRRFGPLTVTLQVQGAIALDYISRKGVEIDLEQAGNIHCAIDFLVAKHMQQLEDLGGDEIFRRYGPKSKNAGQYQLSPSGVPKRNAKLTKQFLQIIAKASIAPIRPPKNKDGLVTDSVKYWKQHQDIDPFIAAYVQFSEQAKLLQFFAKLDSQRIYPKYRPLVRTGRTSCSNPNLQQLPRDARFREMIVAPPGYWLLQIDYSVLELRTLAQICLNRYGKSVLADLFREGVDPHSYTASLLMEITPEQFQQLSAADQKRNRQRAKAINFGVPGGLGAASLVAYAKQSYGVELSLKQAKTIRQQLITQIYPELSAVLQDTQVADMASNLHTTEARVRQAFAKREQRLHASRIVAGCTETPKGDRYQDALIAHVWLCLQQLNSNPELQQDIAAQQPNNLLMRRIFFGNALTISGRLRGHVGFSQKANTPFQGLAADGNKLALFRLLRAGFQVCGFIHDEMLILIPDGTDYTAATEQVDQILVDAMQELCPDIPICTEFLLADRWYKDVDKQPRDVQGRIIPYEKSVE